MAILRCMPGTLSSAAPETFVASQNKAGGRDLSIDYLRTTLTLLVVAHHSSLAYTSWAHFDAVHIFRSTAPIVDSTRWRFFDYAENFNDVFFMSLMFFISGLFVYPAIRKHGVRRFVSDRCLRLFVPFCVAVVVFMPLAYYASQVASGVPVSFAFFYKGLALRHFMVGPPWFIWVLFLFDLFAAMFFVPFESKAGQVGSWMHKLSGHDFGAFVVLFVVAGCAYVPLLARYGFSMWSVLFTSPFAFQTSRIGLYAIWFLAGVLVGVGGLSRGLLARDGGLARRAGSYLLLCLLAYNALWFVPGLAITHRLTQQAQDAIEALLWVLSCVASSFAFLAIFRKVRWKGNAVMSSLSRSAYVIYLVHYVFITWTQLLLRDRRIFAGVKFLLVFIATTLLSWMVAQILIRMPYVRTVV